MSIGLSLQAKSTSFAPGVRIGRLELAVFTLPVLLFQAIELTWRAYLPRFLNQDVGIALGAVGALLLGARLLDAMADPLLGWISDTVRTPFGRRRPWMVFGATLVPFGALLLFLAPTDASMTMIVAASLLLHIGYSFIITPHGGWGLELSDDRHQRTRIMGAKVWFAVVGSLGLLAFLALLERGFAVPLRLEMALLGWAIAVLAPLTVLVVILRFPERPAPDGAGQAGGPMMLIRAMLTNGDMRRILLLYIVTGAADAAAASIFLFLAEDGLGLKGWSATLLMIQPVMALLTLPLWSRLSVRIGRKRVLMIAYAMQALAAPLLFLVPAGQPVLFGAFLVLRALGWGVDYMLLRAMIADVADEGDRGASRFSASYYGVSSITLKIAMGLGGAGGLWLIDLAGRAIWPGGGDLILRMAFAAPAMLAALIALPLLNGGRQMVPHAGTLQADA